jgi:peptidoglycan/LPS O-acetylase OafA/YrhL
VVAVGRVLAARHVAQAAVLAARPTRRADAASAAVDALHGLTMIVLAVVSPRYRRPAATSACVAVAFATVTAVRLERGHSAAPPSPAPAPRPAPAPGSNGPDPAADTGSPAPPHDLATMAEVARQHAADLAHRNERLMDAVTDAPMRSWSRAGAVVLLAVGVWLLVGQWVLSLPLTATADTTATRDEGFAVLLVLAAVRLLVTRRSPTATGVALLGGVLLVCSGLLLEHTATRAAVDELVCGVLAVLCALATLDRWRAGARSEHRATLVGDSV